MESETDSTTDVIQRTGTARPPPNTWYPRGRPPSPAPFHVFEEPPPALPRNGDDLDPTSRSGSACASMRSKSPPNSFVRCAPSAASQAASRSKSWTQHHSASSSLVVWRSRIGSFVQPR
jgi:hypothetical protein